MHSFQEHDVSYTSHLTADKNVDKLSLKQIMLPSLIVFVNVFAEYFQDKYAYLFLQKGNEMWIKLNRALMIHRLN